jgi:hypothetical protein
LELVLLDPALLPRIESAIGRDAIESDVGQRIYDVCARLYHDTQSCDFQQLSLEFDAAEAKNLLVTLFESCQAKESADREQWLKDLLAGTVRRRDEQERRLVLGAAQNSQQDAETLLARFCDESRTKQLTEFERRKK